MPKLRKLTGLYSIITLTLITLIVVTLTSCGGGGGSDGGATKPPWPKTFGGAEDDHGLSIYTDSLENVYVVGTFQETVDFGEGAVTSKGSTDIYIIKYSSEGEYLWSKTIGGAGGEQGRSIGVDSSDNIYIGGVFQGAVDFGGGIVNSTGNSDGYLVKYTPDGDYVWAKTFGGTGSSFGGGHISIDSSDNIYITGQFYETANFGAGNVTSKGHADIYLVKYTSAGNYEWSKTLGGTGIEFVHSICVDTSGNLYIAGTFLGTGNFGAGNVASNNTSFDMYLVKHLSNGDYAWSKTLGGTGTDVITSISTDSADNIYISGYFQQTINFGGGNVTSKAGGYAGFIVKYSQGGVYERAQIIDGNGRDRVFSIFIDSDDNIYTSGEFTALINFGSGDLDTRGKADIFIAKYKSDFTFEWVETLGGPEDDLGRKICKDTSGNVYLTGEFQGTVNFGYGDETSNGKNDVFILKN